MFEAVPGDSRVCLVTVDQHTALSTTLTSRTVRCTSSSRSRLSREADTIDQQRFASSAVRPAKQHRRPWWQHVLKTGAWKVASLLCRMAQAAPSVRDVMGSAGPARGAARCSGGVLASGAVRSYGGTFAFIPETIPGHRGRAPCWLRGVQRGRCHPTTRRFT